MPNLPLELEKSQKKINPINIQQIPDEILRDTQLNSQIDQVIHSYFEIFKLISFK
jgi:hypothetical protein